MSYTFTAEQIDHIKSMLLNGQHIYQSTVGILDKYREEKL